MKRLLLFIGMIACTAMSAQDLKGKFIIEPMIGVPNAGRTYLAFLENSIFFESSNTEITGTPFQYGGRLEYVATEDVGIGFEVNYEESGIKEIWTDYNYNYITQSYEDTTITWSQSKLRMVGRFMYHFSSSEKADWYTGAAIGYTHEKQTNPENMYDTFEYTFVFLPKLLDRVSNPLAGRIYIGTRYMFMDNLGMAFEVGLGSGSILTLGLTGRF